VNCIVGLDPVVAASDTVTEQSRLNILSYNNNVAQFIKWYW